MSPAKRMMRPTNEVSFLKDNVIIWISEWIPFGLNNIISLNDKLESSSNIRHTLLTETIDFSPETSTFETKPTLSRVRVVDFERTGFVEFISDVLFHETGGEKQSEQIGIHVDVSGRVTHGMRVIEAMGSTERFSMDSLSRVVADLVEDSSRVMDTVLNNYQKRLLNLVYAGQSHQRDKFAVITANRIEPEVESINNYLERPELNSEINQVLTNAYRSFTVSDGTKVILGTSGLLLITDDPDQYKHVLVLYPLLNSIRTFQSNVFARMEMTMDNLNFIRKSITDDNYTSVSKLVEEVTLLSGNVIMFEAIFSFIQESIEGISEQLKSLVNLNEYEQEFLQHTDQDVMLETIRARVEDAKFIVDGLEKEITSLEELSTSLSERELKNVFRALRLNTAHSVAIGEALEILEAGIFGIYVIEILNIGMEATGMYENDPLGGALILPSALWIVAIGGIGGVYLGWQLLQRIKKKTIQKFTKKLNLER
jgi:hypothetical protein